MCQYDIGYNLYCPAAGCGKVTWMERDTFRADDFPSLFEGQPCTCSKRWFRWHYWATRDKRDSPKPKHLCRTCYSERKEYKGDPGKADKRWPNIRESIPPKWNPERDVPASLETGWIQEIDIATGEPIDESQRTRHSNDTSPSSGSPRRGSPASDILFRYSPDPDGDESSPQPNVDERFLAPPTTDRRRRAVHFGGLPGRRGRASPVRADHRHRIDDVQTNSYGAVEHSMSARSLTTDAVIRARHRPYAGRWRDDESDVSSTTATAVSQGESNAGMDIPSRSRRWDDGRGRDAESEVSRGSIATAVSEGESAASMPIRSRRNDTSRTVTISRNVDSTLSRGWRTSDAGTDSTAQSDGRSEFSSMYSSSGVGERR